MNLKQLTEQWEIDCVINEAELVSEMKRIPLLHHKYMSVLMDERQRKLSIENQIDTLLPDKTLYYRGKLDEETITRRNWKPFNLYLTGADAVMYITADQEMMELRTKKSIIDEKIKLLDEIIKQINQRGYLIKNIVDWIKFTNGSN